MKNSNFVTPRTLSECYFDPRGSAIEKPLREHIGVLSLLWTTTSSVWRMLTGR